MVIGGDDHSVCGGEQVERHITRVVPKVMHHVNLRSQYLLYNSVIFTRYQYNNEVHIPIFYVITVKFDRLTPPRNWSLYACTVKFLSIVHKPLFVGCQMRLVNLVICL